MTIQKKHENCGACDRMAREAERTAKSMNQDAWISEDGTSVDPRKHWVRYEKEPSC